MMKRRICKGFPSHGTVLGPPDIRLESAAIGLNESWAKAVLAWFIWPMMDNWTGELP